MFFDILHIFILEKDYYLLDLDFLSLLLVDNAGGSESSYNCFFAFIASSFVMSPLLINLFVIFRLFFGLIVLSIYACDIGFETELTLRI
jgi:hypothetical protein